MIAVILADDTDVNSYRSRRNPVYGNVIVPETFPTVHRSASCFVTARAYGIASLLAIVWVEKEFVIYCNIGRLTVGLSLENLALRAR